jgi:hypothetical protein
VTTTKSRKKLFLVDELALSPFPLYVSLFSPLRKEGNIEVRGMVLTQKGEETKIKPKRKMGKMGFGYSGRWFLSICMSLTPQAGEEEHRDTSTTRVM